MHINLPPDPTTVASKSHALGAGVVGLVVAES